MGQVLTKAAFARLRGTSTWCVWRWGRDGLLVLTEDGKVDVEESEARLDARPTVRNGLKTNRRVPFADRPHVEQVDLPPEVLAEIPPRQLAEAADWSHAEAVRRKEIALALIRQLEFDTSSAAVVPIAGVAATVTTEYSRVRDRLLAIPGKVADELVYVRSTCN
jgi:hypothetical protein